LDWPTWRRWNRNWRFRFDVSIVSRSIWKTHQNTDVCPP
jgi:hypothetical protein